MRYKVQFVPIPFGTLAVMTQYDPDAETVGEHVKTFVIPDGEVDPQRLADLVSYLAMLLAESPE
jgi:hypothetical protein